MTDLEGNGIKITNIQAILIHLQQNFHVKNHFFTNIVICILQPIFRQIRRSFKNILAEKLASLGIVNNGSPQSG